MLNRTVGLSPKFIYSVVPMRPSIVYSTTTIIIDYDDSPIIPEPDSKHNILSHNITTRENYPSLMNVFQR